MATNGSKIVWVTLGIWAVANMAFGQAWALDKLRFGLSARANPSYVLPFLAAEEKGFWKRNELDTEFIPFDAGAALFRAMAAGALDMALGGVLSDVQAIIRGVPVILVTDLKSPQDFYIYVRADSKIRGPADLKGARIGVTRFGGLVHAYALAIAKSLGLERDIKFVTAGGAMQEIAAVKAGVEDGTIVSFFAMAPLLFKGEMRPAVAVRDYLPREWMDVTISARKDFAQKNPQVVKRGLKALFQAADFVMKDSDWTVEKLKSQYGYTEAGARMVHRDILRYGKEGKIDRKAMENVRNFLIDYGIVPKEKVPPVESLYTNEYNE